MEKLHRQVVFNSLEKIKNSPKGEFFISKDLVIPWYNHSMITSRLVYKIAIVVGVLIMLLLLLWVLLNGIKAGEE